MRVEHVQGKEFLIKDNDGTILFQIYSHLDEKKTGFYLKHFVNAQAMRMLLNSCTSVLQVVVEKGDTTINMPIEMIKEIQKACKQIE
jgi:hypothetical protein